MEGEVDFQHTLFISSSFCFSNYPQIDIPYSEHSHVIGKEGVNIKRGVLCLCACLYDSCDPAL